MGSLYIPKYSSNVFWGGGKVKFYMDVQEPPKVKHPRIFKGNQISFYKTSETSPTCFPFGAGLVWIFPTTVLMQTTHLSLLSETALHKSRVSSSYFRIVKEWIGFQGCIRLLRMRKGFLVWDARSLEPSALISQTQKPLQSSHGPSIQSQVLLPLALKVY